MNWHTFITTCPRQAETLADTMKAVMDAGWNIDDIAEDRDKQLGAWRNFKAALQRAVDAQPSMILACQDDIDIAVGLREWFENQYSDEVGVFSFYLAEKLAGEYASERGWFQLSDEDMPRKAYGALCYAIHPTTAEKLLQCDELEKRQAGSKHKTDYFVSWYCWKSSTSFFLHNPGLVQHTGIVSAIDPNREYHNKYRRAKAWIKDVKDLT